MSVSGAGRTDTMSKHEDLRMMYKYASAVWSQTDIRDTFSFDHIYVRSDSLGNHLFSLSPSRRQAIT